jgi:ADP-ribosyl-[dinitrogen reductase] hydrolase
MTDTSFADRVRGTLLGGAIGDALGAAFEGMPNAAIEAVLGSQRVLDYRPGERDSILAGHPAGQPTDDTAMALSLARVLASAPRITARVIARAFRNDLSPDGRYGRLFYQGAPGIATTRALRRLANGAQATNNGYPEDGGNGAAMRAHPVGVLPDRGRVSRIAALQARITHGHPAAVAAAQAVALIVHDLLWGQPLTPQPPLGITETVFLGAWRRAHRNLTLDDGGRLPPHLRDVAKSGWETVSAAHAIAVLFADDPEAGIAAAAASGLDTDTVGCICGAFLGAAHGAQRLPSPWVHKLGVRDLVEEAAAALLARYHAERLQEPP